MMYILLRAVEGVFLRASVVNI